jgi:hypothetical protein
MAIPAICQIGILPTDSLKLVLVDFDYPTETVRLQPNRERVRSVGPGINFIPQLVILPDNETGYVLKTIAIPIPLVLDSIIVDNPPGSLTKFSGTWSHFINTTTNWYLNTASVSSQSGATVSYECNPCRQIKWYTEKYPTHGKVAVSIDDGPEKVVDLYNATRQSKIRVFQSDILPEGKHTIKIRCTGTRNSAASNHILIHDYFTIIKKKNAN